MSSKTPKYIYVCPNPDCDCLFDVTPPTFDKTTVWPLFMGKDFLQTNVDEINKTWSFDTYVCACCGSQFMDIVSKE